MTAVDRGPSDVVAALFLLTGQEYLSADAHRLHRALQVAREQCPLLEVFAFSARGPERMSRSFDEALSRLKLSRLVRMENTDYERYIIDASAKNYIRNTILPKFNDAERASLTRAAAIVGEECRG
jgi:hypothetical protein